MNSIATLCERVPRLNEATANELNAVSGGTYSMYDRGSKTGVIFHDGGGIEIWNNGVYHGSITGGKFVPCTSHCTTA